MYTMEKNCLIVVNCVHMCFVFQYNYTLLAHLYGQENVGRGDEENKRI